MNFLHARDRKLNKGKILACTQASRETATDCSEVPTCLAFASFLARLKSMLPFVIKKSRLRGIGRCLHVWQNYPSELHDPLCIRDHRLWAFREHTRDTGTATLTDDTHHPPQQPQTLSQTSHVCTSCSGRLHPIVARQAT